jgi:carbamoyltransferase
VIVLSIHDGHDSGACLFRDGRIVLHSSEERRINVKQYMGVPEQSIRAVLERSGTDPKDVDLVALCGTIRTFSRPAAPESVKPARLAMKMMISLSRSETATKVGRAVLSRLRRRGKMDELLAELGLGQVPVRAYDHHLCHAACAYWHRPWEGRALVLTHDGAGDGLCASVNVGADHELKVIDQTPKFHSLANFLYSSITAHLGLKPWEHEYKVMGMAPYGRSQYCVDILRPMWGVEGLKFRNKTGRSHQRLQRYYRRKLAGQRFDNLSAACQLVFEELMLKWVHNAIEATGIHKVAAAGGAFLNVKANALIRESDSVEAFYAYPASDDGGTPIGAAILGYLDLCKDKGVAPVFNLPRDMYLGLEFSEQEMEASIKAAGHAYRRLEEPAEEIASQIAQGRIIARFDGREEVGPRALGNRSILADPRDLRAIRKINFAIKKRDFWMPFAPSILEEDVRRYVKGTVRWPFWMIEAFETTPEAERDIICGMHPMDLTARPQVVNDMNPAFRQIIRAFKEKTGVGAVLNTSFNLHGYPIVGTPEMALHTLDNSDLDGLVLGPFFVSRKDRPG